MLGVVVSEADEASTHVREHLLALADWDEREDGSRSPAEGGGIVHRLADAELRSFEGLHLELDGVADAFDDPSAIAIASRHSGDTGPLLTAHHTGNFGPAEFGGEERTLARAAPNAHRVAVEALATYAPEGYEVGMECTHHGPTNVGAPSLFVEVGSGPDEWADPDAAEAVARAIMALREVPPDVPEEDDTRRHLVGFGGGHYAPRYERIVRETDWAVGHVAADWALEDLGEPADAADVIEQAIEKSAGDRALLANHRPGLASVIEDLGYRVVDEKWIRETTGVPLGLVDDLEGVIGSISDGLRFGTPARHTAGDTPVVTDFVVGSIPADLLSEATGIDREATMAAVDSSAIAYDTEQGGSVLGGTVALRERTDGNEIVDRLAGLLENEYDEVDGERGAIVAVVEQFDPKLARDAGVPSGPDFGRLAEGEAVTVDGNTVHPGDVTETVERRFSASLTWA